jgi:hypothetical protein
MPHEQRCAERGARPWLNPNVLKLSLAQQPPVRHAIERYAPGQHEMFHLRPPMQFAAHAQHDFLRHRLDAHR